MSETMGRPTAYNPEYVEQGRKLAKLGAKDTEIADFFEVDVRTIYRWKAEHEDFCQALKVGKSKADERVVRGLYERATGYTHPEDKIFMAEGVPVTVPTMKHYPPDTTAAIFWLKNRNSQKWRDKVDHEHGGNVSINLPTGSDKV